MNASVIAKLPILWKHLGLFITFLFLNLFAFMYMRVGGVFIRLWKICKWICGLLLVSVVVGFFKCMCTFCVSILGKVEKEGKKHKRKKGKKGERVFGAK